MNRRGFLKGLASALAGPMIVKYDHLMPVKVMEPSMAFDIETVSVFAKTRYLKAEYTISMEDIESDVCDYAVEELTNLLNKEIINEISRSERSRIIYPMSDVRLPKSPVRSNRILTAVGTSHDRHERDRIGGKSSWSTLPNLCNAWISPEFRLFQSENRPTIGGTDRSGRGMFDVPWLVRKD